MKIVVIGGSGLIGSKLVKKLREHGHAALAASPNSGVNTLTGEGLAEALKGASVVVDVSNSPSFEEKASLDFFTTATGNLLRYEQAAGVQHHVALSVVGTERLAQRRPSDGEKTIRGYFRAKLVQEKLIAESPIPFRSSMQHSSLSLPKVLLMLPRAVRRFEWHLCSSSPWRPKMLHPQLDKSLLALL